VEDLEIQLDLPLDSLGDALAFRLKLRPEEFSASARVRDGIFRPNPESTPLEQISALVQLKGNVLEIPELQIWRGGKPLPELGITIDGMHRLVRLPVEERCTPSGPGVPIPGLGPLFASRSDDPNRPVTRFHLLDCHVAYPSFVLPFRNVSGWLSFPDGGVALEDAEGVLGGAPALVNALWDRRNMHISVDVQYRDWEAPPLTHTDESRREWLGGRYEIAESSFYRWPMDHVVGTLRAVGDQIQLGKTHANLGGGELVFTGSISLAKAGHAPVQIELDLNGADGSKVGAPLGLGRRRLTGTTSIKGTARALLEPGHPFLENAQIVLELELRDGTLHDLPFTVALARIPSLRGLSGLFGQPLPYKSITAELTIDQGQLRTENFILRGPQLGITAAGEMDLLSPDLQTDLLIALLMLQTVDRMIETLPVVRDLVLGPDGSLVTVYIKLEGPRNDLNGRLVPPETVRRATDLTTRIIVSGVTQLRKWIGFPRSNDGANKEPGQGQDR
jgi:hypothetical protein